MTRSATNAMRAQAEKILAAAKEEERLDQEHRRRMRELHQERLNQVHTLAEQIHERPTPALEELADPETMRAYEHALQACVADEQCLTMILNQMLGIRTSQIWTRNTGTMRISLGVYLMRDTLVEKTSRRAIEVGHRAELIMARPNTLVDDVTISIGGRAICAIPEPGEDWAMASRPDQTGAIEDCISSWERSVV